jgi:hypothetical protein
VPWVRSNRRRKVAMLDVDCEVMEVLAFTSRPAIRAPASPHPWW